MWTTKSGLLSFRAMSLFAAAGLFYAVSGSIVITSTAFAANEAPSQEQCINELVNDEAALEQAKSEIDCNDAQRSAYVAIMPMRKGVAQCCAKGCNEQEPQVQQKCIAKCVGTGTKSLVNQVIPLLCPEQVVAKGESNE